jgi:hypothetical protein
VDETKRPSALDLRSRHVAAHREMRVQPQPIFVPLAGPEIRERIPAESLRSARKNAPTCSRRSLGSPQKGGPYVRVANLFSRFAAQ